MSRDSKGQTPTLPTLPSQSGVFDALWRDVFDRIEALDSEGMPTMATVTGLSGGEVIVHIDGEKISRTVGFARKKGVTYKVGQRVSLKMTRNGEYIVDGIVGSDSSDRSVGRTNLAIAAVGGAELAFGIVESSHLSPTLNSRLDGFATTAALNKEVNDLYKYVNDWVDWLRANCRCR